MLTPEQRDAMLWAVRKYPTLTLAKAVEMLEAAGGI
jgi:hypothetical protein